MQYSLFAHGNVLEIETPIALAHQVKLGWGTQVTFHEPVPREISGLQVFDKIGPGSRFHMPLPSTLTTFGRRNPRLKSVTLLFDTSHCRITNVHIYDGSRIVQEFNSIKLAGQFLQTRDPEDINPEALLLNAQSFPNTLRVDRPHRIFSAVGVSFFACAFFEDFNVQGQAHDPRFHGPFPPAILTVSGCGAQFIIEDASIFAVKIGPVHILGP